VGYSSSNYIQEYERHFKRENMLKLVNKDLL
jgi:hypothetical protein